MLRRMPDYGELLKALRIKRGLSQKELARRAGVAQSLISQIENTGATPRLDTWAAIMGALDMAFDHMPRAKESPVRARLLGAVALLDEPAIERLACLAEVLDQVPEFMIDGLVLMGRGQRDGGAKRQGAG